MFIGRVFKKVSMEEDGDSMVHRGPLTMAISNRKQDMTSEDGDWVIHRGPLTMAIFNRKQDTSGRWGLGGPVGSSYDGYLQQEARYTITIQEL